MRRDHKDDLHLEPISPAFNRLILVVLLLIVLAGLVLSGCSALTYGLNTRAPENDLRRSAK